MTEQGSPTRSPLRRERRTISAVHRRRLAEAGAIWREIGNPLGEAKVDLVLASIDRGAGSAALRRKAERQLEIARSARASERAPWPPDCSHS